MNLIGYGSEAEVEALRSFGVPDAAIYVDKAGWRERSRPGWEACWAALRHGDLLVVHSASNLGRDLVEIIQTINALHTKGACIKALNMDIDTTTPDGMFMLRAIATMVEWQARLTSERTLVGTVRSKGGRKPKISHDEALLAMMRIRRGEKANLVAGELGVARQVIYRKVDEAMHEPWRLTTEDSKRFVEALLNPPEPNAALRAAAERYKALRQTGGDT